MFEPSLGFIAKPVKSCNLTILLFRTLVKLQSSCSHDSEAAYYEPLSMISF
jgi:hypothetical protein